MCGDGVECALRAPSVHTDSREFTLGNAVQPFAIECALRAPTRRGTPPSVHTDSREFTLGTLCRPDYAAPTWRTMAFLSIFPIGVVGSAGIATNMSGRECAATPRWSR